MRGASPLSCLSLASAIFAFAIRTPNPGSPNLGSSLRVAVDQRRKLLVRLVPRRAQPLLLDERRFFAFVLQPGRRRRERSVDSGPGRQRVYDQNEVAISAFRVGITSSEGKGQSLLQVEFLDQRDHTCRGQYGI